MPYNLLEGRKSQHWRAGGQWWWSQPPKSLFLNQSASSLGAVDSLFMDKIMGLSTAASIKGCRWFSIAPVPNGKGFFIYRGLKDLLAERKSWRKKRFTLNWVPITKRLAQLQRQMNARWNSQVLSSNGKSGNWVPFVSALKTRKPSISMCSLEPLFSNASWCLWFIQNPMHQW